MQVPPGLSLCPCPRSALGTGQLRGRSVLEEELELRILKLERNKGDAELSSEGA